MAASLKEVAQKAGVSASTVSRVLSPHRDGRAQIAPETQEIVKRAAQELGYRPNEFARSLITGRTNTLGLMIARLSNPFFVSLLEEAEARALEAGYSVLVENNALEASAYLQAGRLTRWPVDGVLMWSHPGEQLSDYIGTRTRRTPVVYVCDQRRSDEAYSVDYDLASGARALITHLLKRGYRRPMHLVAHHDAKWIQSDARAATYARVCEEAGVRLQVRACDPAGETREAGFGTATRLLAELRDQPRETWPDVLVCHNDLMALGAYAALQRAKVRVPEEMAVCGFDGLDEGRWQTRELTTVRIDAPTLCRRAVALLIARIGGEADAPEPRQQTVPCQLVPAETA